MNPARDAAASGKLAPGEFSIREATLQDLDTILAHRRAMFEEMRYGDAPTLNTMSELSEHYLRDGLGDGTYKGWLAETPERKVAAGGGIGLITWPASPRNLREVRPTIFNVYTEPAYRHRGLARRLMEVMIEWCRAEGFRAVNLHASEFGRPLYVAMGFEPTNEMRLILRE